MTDNIMVSVVCLAYNHEKYIRQALEGFVSQKTTFPFEVIVHDDASTDGTASIIKEYEEKYPDIIRPIYQEKNQHSQKIPIHKNHTLPLVNGKYVAFCEGDDYWTDAYKLQKQFDKLETHPECSMCTHKIQNVREDGTAMNSFRPSIELPEGGVDTQGFLNIQRYYPFQTASYFMRASLWRKYINDPPAFRRAADVGDEPMLLYMAAHGDIYYLPECMSVYRNNSVGSWSYKNKFNPGRKATHAQKMHEMMRLYDEYTGHAYDCHLPLFRGRALLYNKNFKELLKRENRWYLHQLSFAKRVFVYMGAVFPFMGRFVK